MSDPSVMNAFDESMDEDPDWFDRPEVQAYLAEANEIHRRLYGGSAEEGEDAG